MKRNILTIAILLIASTCFSQKKIININREECYILWETKTPSGSSAFVVIVNEELAERDRKILRSWSKLNHEAQQICAEQWRIEGKRIEIFSKNQIR